VAPCCTTRIGLSPEAALILHESYCLAGQASSALLLQRSHSSRYAEAALRHNPLRTISGVHVHRCGTLPRPIAEVDVIQTAISNTTHPHSALDQNRIQIHTEFAVFLYTSCALFCMQCSDLLAPRKDYCQCTTQNGMNILLPRLSQSWVISLC
jgi:hypothetical protein